MTFAKEDGAGCRQRTRCILANDQPRSLQIQPQPQQEAIDRMRTDLEREAGRRLYAKRTAIEGTWSQGVQGVGLRCNRSIGLAKTYVQQVAIAAAL